MTISTLEMVVKEKDRTDHGPPHHVAMSKKHARWIDLPDHIVELVLERLPLLDYIHFGAVCRGWQSTQSNHRCSQSPSPLPMGRPFPIWLMVSDQQYNSNDKRLCYSPFDEKFYCVQLPPSARGKRYVASAHGWLLMAACPKDPLIISSASLFNPISGAEIQLPPLLIRQEPLCAAMSCPPTKPNCIVVVFNGEHILLCRVGDDEWTILQQEEEPVMPFFYMGPLIRTAVFCGGKFYGCNSTRREQLTVVDPSTSPPTIEQLKMDHKLLPRRLLECCCLVESVGEVLLVTAFCKRLCDSTNLCFHIKRFEVFKADFAKKKWVRVESLGDRVLFVGEGCSVSLSAVDVGGVGNRIYYSPLWKDYRRCNLIPWQLFNVETGRSVYGWIPSTTKHHCESFVRSNLHWFTPSLVDVRPAEASRAELLERKFFEDLRGKLHDYFLPQRAFHCLGRP